MNILVCVKQVPDTTEIKIDPVTKTLIRAGVPSIVNPYDGYALEVAARIKDKEGGKVVLLSMGPPQAKDAIKECLAVGGDKGYLVSDRAFGGADTLATSYTLTMAIKTVEELEGKFDIIFCGKQAIDGDTAQVGPEIAEHLGYPQVTYAVEAEMVNGELQVKRETEDGAELIAVQLPALVTVTKPHFEIRYPTVKSKLAANRAEIPMLTAADVKNVDTSRLGLAGSPTKVKKSFTPDVSKKGVKIKEETGAESAKKLAALLNAAGVM